MTVETRGGCVGVPDGLAGRVWDLVTALGTVHHKNILSCTVWLPGATSRDTSSLLPGVRTQHLMGQTLFLQAKGEPRTPARG